MRNKLLTRLLISLVLIPGMARAQADWKEFNDIVGRFTVMMPDHPGEPIGDFPATPETPYSMIF